MSLFFLRDKGVIFRGKEQIMGEAAYIIVKDNSTAEMVFVIFLWGGGARLRFEGASPWLLACVTMFFM